MKILKKKLTVFCKKFTFIIIRKVLNYFTEKLKIFLGYVFRCVIKIDHFKNLNYNLGFSDVLLKLITLKI